MDFRQLQYFTVVAQELNISRAAERLNMSQPPLSSQIKNLEEDLGVKLFIRNSRNLKLTPEGSHLLLRAEQMLTIAEQTRSELSSMNHMLSGTLRLGVVEGRAPFLAAKWIAGFHEEYPNVMFRLWNGSSDDVIEHMEHGLSDLCLIAAPYDNEHLNGITASREPWTALIPKDHSLAKAPGTTVRLADLAGEPLIIPQRHSRIDAIRRWFGSINQEPKIVCEMSSFLDAAALAAQNVGIGIFPQTVPVSSLDITIKTIVEPAKTAEYVLVWFRDRRPSMVAEEFINYVTDTMQTENNGLSSAESNAELL